MSKDVVAGGRYGQTDRREQWNRQEKAKEAAKHVRSKTGRCAECASCLNYYIMGFDRTNTKIIVFILSSYSRQLIHILL